MLMMVRWTMSDHVDRYTGTDSNHSPETFGERGVENVSEGD